MQNAARVWRNVNYLTKLDLQLQHPVDLSAISTDKLEKKADENDVGDCTLDLAVPADVLSSPPPLLVFIHGGLWMSGRKEEGAHMARLLASSSNARMAVAMINYHLSPQSDSSKHEYVHPAHTEEVSLALHWLATHAEHFGIDKQRVAVIGHSVGAHMVASICLSGHTAAGASGLNIRAVVSLEGLFDVARFWEDEPEWRKYIECSLSPPPLKDEKDRTENSVLDPEEVKKAWPSPVHLQPEAVPAGLSPCKCPWLVVHSTADPWLKVNQAFLWQDHLRKWGIPCTMHIMDRGDHDEVLQWCCASEQELALSRSKKAKSKAWTESLEASAAFVLTAVVQSFLRANGVLAKGK